LRYIYKVNYYLVIDLNLNLPASICSLIPRTNPNKMEYLYLYAIEYGINSEKFSIITEAEKKRWSNECFCNILKIKFYCDAVVEKKEDPKRYINIILTDCNRLTGEVVVF
jgi:hypothetical protein